MIEHLFCNAHGEWDFIRYLLMAVPFIGPAVVASLFKRKAKGCCGDDDNHAHP